MKININKFKNPITFKSLSSNKISYSLKKKILLLKMQHYKYSYSKQSMWFNKNIKSYDLHNIILIKNKLVGYTCLRVKKYFNFKNKKKKNLIFDTCIVDINYRGLGIGSKLMKYNNKIINKKKIPAFLLCKKKLLNFYEKFKWKKLYKKNVNFADHNTKGLNIMAKNFYKKNKHSIKIYLTNN